MTRFEQIKNCQTPEEMCVVLNADERKFCPFAYSRKPGICQPPCGRCIIMWLKEEIEK